MGRIWRSTGHYRLFVVESPQTCTVCQKKKGRISSGATHGPIGWFVSYHFRAIERLQAADFVIYYYPHFFRQRTPDPAYSGPALLIFVRFRMFIPMTQGMSPIETRLFINNEVRLFSFTIAFRAFCSTLSDTVCLLARPNVFRCL